MKKAPFTKSTASSSIGDDSWTALRLKLDIDSRSLAQWRKLPDAPQTHDIEQWTAYLEAEAGLGNVPDSKEKDALKREKLRGEIRLNELRIQKELARSVLVSDVEERDAQVASLQKTILNQKLGEELGARCAGKTAEELCVLGGQIADEICEIFSQPLESWRGYAPTHCNPAQVPPLTNYEK